jgi:hypothetical protein
MTKSLLSALVLSFVFALGCTPVYAPQGTTSTATATNTATTAKVDALPVQSPDTAPANTANVTNTVTNTVTATNTSTVKLDAGTMVVDTAPVNTGTPTSIATATNTSTVKFDAAPVQSPDTAPVLQPDTAVVVTDGGVVDAPVQTPDKTKPVVQTPYIGAGDIRSLPVGTSLSFYVSASDESVITLCQFYLNKQSAAGFATPVTSDKWQQSIVLAAGKNTIDVVCSDAANNMGYSPTLEVWAGTGSTDSGVASSDVLVAADTQPAPTPAPDAQVQTDTTPASPICIDGEFDPLRYCMITLDNNQTRIGNVSCKGGTWSKCLDINPPVDQDSCAGGFAGQVDDWVTCMVFEGCYSGIRVCNGTTWKWECKLDTSWYISANCVRNDAGSPDTIVTPADTRPADTTPIVVTDGGTDTLVLADTQVSTDTTPLPDADYSKGWPYINCLNTEATGAFVSITLDGKIEGPGTDGVSNLTDQQSSSFVSISPVICVVGADGIGWYNRDVNHCVPWVAGTTHITFPTFQVNTLTLTDINYVIDYGNGQMIWGNNARLLFTSNAAPIVNRCGRGGSKGNLIIKANGT